MYKVAINLVLFLKFPTLDRSDVSWKEIRCLFLLNFFITIIYLGLVEIFNLGIDDDGDGDFYETIKNNKIIFLILGVIVFPLFEEFIFRYWLVIRRNKFLFPILLCLLFIFTFEKYEIVKITLYVTYLIFILSVFIRSKRKTSNSKFAFFGSASFFALAHVFNYEIHEIDNTEYFKLIISIIPQFIGGLILGYIRIKFGIWYSFIFHSSWNFLLLLIVVLSI